MFRLAFDPKLEVSTQDFAMLWNEDEVCSRIGIAQVDKTPGSTFDPILVEIVNIIVVQLAIGVATNAVYDLIKDILLKL